MKSKTLHRFVPIIAAALTLVACDTVDNSAPETARVSLNIVATNTAVAAKAGIPKSGSAVAEVTAARVLLRTIQFHGRDDADTEEGFEFRTDPMIANLVAGVPPVPFELADVPVGTYHKVSFRIHKPEEEESGFEDFWEGPGGNERYSVLAHYMLDTQPPVTDTYKSSKSMQQKIDFDGDLVIDENTTEVNVTLLVDLSKWFVDDDGQPLDPTDASPANTNAIDKSIRESFRIFKDKNRDGVPDTD